MLIISSCKLAVLISALRLYNITKWKWLEKYIKKLIFTNGIFVIKLAQWLSTRPDIIDENLYKIFNEFKDKCPSHSYKATCKIIKKTIGEDIDDIFLNFDKEPIASGSIAQVYRAKFKKCLDCTISRIKYCDHDDNMEIAIKIKHPHIEDKINEYKKIVHFITKLLKNTYSNKVHVDIDEFYDDVAQQIDLINESNNATKFSELFKNDPFVIIPKVLYSHKNIIIYSYEKSTSIKTFIEENKFTNIRETLIKFVHVAFKPLFLDGIFHGDLHDGNWGINEEGKIVLYDFGHIGNFNIDNFTKLTKTVATYDKYTWIYTLITYLDINNKISNFENIINGNLDSIEYSKKMGINLFNVMMKLCHAYKLKLDVSYINIVFMITTVEFYKNMYYISNYYKNGDILFEELKKISNDIRLTNIYDEILLYLKNHRYIKSKTIEIIQSMRYTLKYFIDDDLEELLLSFVNLLHVLNILSPTEIIDTIHLFEKNINNEKYIEKINNFIQHIKNNKYMNDMNFILNLQKKLFILREIYDNIDDDNIEEQIDKYYKSILNK